MRTMPGLDGFYVFQLYKYLMMELIRMEKLDKATAGFVVKWKNAMINETAIPPPPMPATTQSAMTSENVKSPPISSPVGGITFLCPQYPAFLIPHTSYGYSSQSASTLHFSSSSNYIIAISRHVETLL